jgi:hypothetical protein
MRLNSTELDLAKEQWIGSLSFPFNALTNLMMTDFFGKRRRNKNNFKKA